MAKFLVFWIQFYRNLYSQSHNNSNYSLLHSKNLCTVTRIPSSYYSTTHDCMEKGMKMRHKWLNISNYVPAVLNLIVRWSKCILHDNILSIVNPRNLVNRALGINLFLRSIFMSIDGLFLVLKWIQWVFFKI